MTKSCYSHVFEGLSEGLSIQWKNFHGVWITASDDFVMSGMIGNRVKPEHLRVVRLVHINGHPVPVGLSKSPQTGSTCWVADAGIERSRPLVWRDSSDQQFLLLAGLLHDSQEAADFHGFAMRSFTLL